MIIKLLWHVEPLLGNDCKISNYTTGSPQEQENTAIMEVVFSMLSMHGCYKQGQLHIVVSKLVIGQLL
jgi:hypothetical protein